MAHQFSVNQKTLLSILSSMQPICSKRTTLDATSFILFNVGLRELTLKSTDLEISLQSTCTVESSDIEETQSFLVSGRRIIDLVKELDGEINFTLDNQQLQLRSGSVNLALNLKDAADFPPFPERIENLMQFDADFILGLFDKVAFLIPQNNTNPALNGLFLEIDTTGLKMTTTDGHCLAQVRSEKYTLAQPQQWLLPRRAIFEIKKILEGTDGKDVFLGLCGNQLVFSGESFNFFSKLLADAFPQYQGIMQKVDFIPATIDRTHFIKTLRRSSCLLSGQFLATQFGFENNEVDVTIQNKEVGNLKESVPVEGFKGARLDIRFFAPYLLSGLQAFSDEKIQFYLKNSAKPIIFESRPDGYQVTYLVMPVSPTTT